MPDADEGYDRDALADAHGRLQAHFRANEAEYESLASALAAARVARPVDEHLARWSRRAAVAAVLGAGLGLVAGLALAFTGDHGPGVAPALLVGLSLGGSLVAGGGSLAVGRYYPRLLAHQRRRRIDMTLPHAAIFLYALSHGGMDLYEILERVAEADDVYGEVAAEFETVTRDLEWFDRDLFEALSAARESTPSEELTAFLDELVSVLETGGDVDDFLRDEAERHLAVAERQQEDLLSDLGTLAEVYITVVFAGPIFLLVVLLVGSFVVPGLLLPMRLLVYLAIPLAIALFGLAIDYLLEPYRRHVGRSSIAEATWRQALPAGLWAALPWTSGAESEEGSPSDDRIAAYRQARERSRIERLVEQPLARMAETPAYSLAVTVPLGGLAVAGLLLVGVPETVDLAAHPVTATTTLFAVPFLVAAVPFAVLHERERRRERTVRTRLPTALSIVADADANAVPLTESFALVANRMSGPLADELARVDRDAAWSDDVAGALERFADRSTAPAVDRVVRLLTESLRSTDDLAPVLSVVADDLETRNDIRATQRSEMQPYVVVVFLGVLVFLAIVVMFETQLLPVVADAAARSASTVGRTPLALSGVDLGVYRLLFFHAALIQAVGNGLLLGKLVDNRVASGVKYAAALVAVELVVFLALG